jgi:hypothetical protein
MEYPDPPFVTVTDATGYPIVREAAAPVPEPVNTTVGVDVYPEPPLVRITFPTELPFRYCTSHVAPLPPPPVIAHPTGPK